MRYFSSPSYWNSIFLLSPGFVYDESHDFWSDGYPEGLYELTRDSYGENEENRKFEQQRLGFQRVHIGGWEGNIVQADTTYMDAIENLDDFLLENIENRSSILQRRRTYDETSRFVDSDTKIKKRSFYICCRKKCWNIGA